jgi:hypothetical protein
MVGLDGAGPPRPLRRTLDLASQLFFSPIQSSAMVGSLCLGYENLTACHVKPDLGSLLHSISIEHHRRLHGTGGQVPQAFDDRDRTLPQRLGNLAMARRDSCLHACSFSAAASGRALDDIGQVA